MEKKVFICSPYAPISADPVERKQEQEKNREMALDASFYAVLDGNVPFTPHLYFPQFLDDDDPDQRDVGMLMGLMWLRECDEIWVIGKRISEGMKEEIGQAQNWGIPVKHFVYCRTPEERLYDAIFFPDVVFHEMNWC